MYTFTTRINKFKSKGEKTGWTYLDIPFDVAQNIKPNCKRAFRVKGTLDNFKIKGVALIPMGDGNFILALNATIRKGITKKVGDMLFITLQEDKEEYKIDFDFLTCLADAPEADSFFKTLTKSHQHYFSKWIQSAKTDATKAKRIAQAVNAMLKKQGFPEMVRANKKQ